MTQKKNQHTGTTEFEVEGIEEAYAPASPAKKRGVEKLEVETPPELREPVKHTARAWIFERRARGILALMRRWFVGRRRKP